MNVMVQAVLKAGRGLTRDFGEVENLQVSMKGPGDFVTAADRRADKTLIAELRKARPTYSVLTEESGAIEGSDSAHRWIIDPLDGTTNFLHGIPLFAISVALEREGKPAAAVIYNPILNELYTAERGTGAFLNDRRLRVAARRNIADALIGCGMPHLGNPATDSPDTSARVSSRAAGARSIRIGGARTRLGRFGPPRRLLAPSPGTVGFGGRHAAGSRGRRLRSRPGGKRQESSRPARSSPAIRRFTNSCFRCSH